MCLQLGRDTSWAWCEDCKRAYPEEREAMLESAGKSSCGALAAAHLQEAVERGRTEKVCDICGGKFMGVARQKRCGQECRKEANRRRDGKRHGAHRKRPRTLQAVGATRRRCTDRRS